MKITYPIQILALFFLAAVLSCSGPSSNESENSNKTDTDQAEKVVDENKDMSIENQAILKEQLFFHIREKVIDIDELTFIKYESLDLNGEQFKYSAVIMDRRRLIPNYTSTNSQNNNVMLASYFHDSSNDLLGDSIKVEGRLKVLNGEGGVESSINEVTINIIADYETSYLASSPYGYGEYERLRDWSEVDQNMIVQLDKVREYPKEELYLKARLFELTEKDLEGLSKDELGYLRNEIFAWHGHTFKTEKMQKYFEDQLWYMPFFDDATKFLNEMEKRNVQFIRSLES